MKKIILVLMAGIMIFSLLSCGAQSSNKPIEIAQNEQGLYGLKQGSKWLAEPVYVKMVFHQFESGTFFIGKRVPGTQKYYHVLFNSQGKMLKECNIASYGKTYLDFVTPGEVSSTLDLLTTKENSGNLYTAYSFKDIFADSK
jgi:hypothetical protein